MDLSLELLSIQNPWWRGGDLRFEPVLEQYNRQALKWRPAVAEEINLGQDKIYFLTGLKGVGKTTLMKLLIKKLLEEGKTDPQNLFFYSCHNLESYEQLNEMVKLFLNRGGRDKKRRYIFLDEVNMVKNWRRGLVYLIKAGIFKNVTVVLAGSAWDKAAGDEIGVEVKIINGLDFGEFIGLINPDLKKNLNQKSYAASQGQMDYYLDIYLLTGGFISAVNDFKQRGAVSQSIYSNFLHWFLAYVARAGRDVVLTRQLMEKIILNLAKGVGYKTLAQKTKAKTHLTAAEYLKLLESMFAVKTVYQASGQAASGKAKKIYFQDPFIFWLFYCYVHGSLDYWQFSRERLHDRQVFSALVKNVVFSHLLKNGACRRPDPAYWRDNLKKQEIDFLINKKGAALPILVNYNQVAGKQADDSAAAKEFLKRAGFNQGIIISRDQFMVQRDFKIVPLTYFLLFYSKLLTS